MLGTLAIHTAAILLEDDGEEPEEVEEAGPGFAASCFMVFMPPSIGAINFLRLSFKNYQDPLCHQIF